MNINQALLDYSLNSSEPPYDLLAEYNCMRDDISDFLTTQRTFEDRQRVAIDVIERVLTYHGKEDLLRHVAETRTWRCRK